jgi:RHS repeat-associated protein
MHLDHLGTPRLVTGANGVKVAEHELAPFGIEPTPLWEDSTTHGFDREDPMRFTGHERDFAQLSRIVTTPYLDYMHARYYSATVGRFLSVDPLLDKKSALENPQAWNRYAYVRNSAMTFTDPTGKYMCEASPEQCKKIELGIRVLRFAAADALMAGKTGSFVLYRAAAFLGKTGQNNGVFVQVANLAVGTRAGTDTSLFGRTDITFDRAFIRGVVGSSFVDLADVAASAAHEADHGDWNKEIGQGMLLFGSAFRRFRVAQEKRAYMTEAFVYQSLGVDDPSRVWTPSGGWNSEELDRAAERSVAASLGPP